MITIEKLKKWRACSDAITTVEKSGRKRLSATEVLKWCKTNKPDWAVWLTGSLACREMLVAGAEVNAKGNYGSTPLIWTARKGLADICTLLLAAGAEVNAKNNSGSTPLMWAALNGHADICALLLAAGAEVNEKDNYGSTPLMWAVRNGHTDICALLRKAGAKLKKNKSF